MITDRLTRELGKPFMSQMAVDSIWEEAVAIDFTQGSIEEQLSNNSLKPGRLALEVFYKFADGRIAYFGFKHDDSFKHAPTQKLLINKLTKLLPRVAGVDFAAGVELFGEELNGDSNTFLQQLPDELELGVSNHWYSAGPCKIWETGSPVLTQERLTEKLKNHELLMQNNLNFIGLEHIFTNPTNHWFSVEVSDLNADGLFVLNQPFALQVAQLTF